ncbi:glycosyltransferase family 2 protein, partial [Candidatus Sumerlaeota bacterium]|nr:glycosyltransferase family 2 protein [Candidatus Sumerlaeota bacterium]
MDPTVTVIIPAFNSAPYLRATLESVRAQTFQNWELILSDDGSTDDTVSIAETFAREDPRIRVLRNPAGRNPAVRRNDGMRQGRGEYFAFLDSDDLWLPEKLQAQLDAMRQIAKPGVCYTFTEEFSSDPTLELRGWPKFIPPPDKESQYQLSLLTYNWA